jgi:hypothetical protein
MMHLVRSAPDLGKGVGKSSALGKGSREELEAGSWTGSRDELGAAS